MTKQSFLSPLISIAIYLFLTDRHRLTMFVAAAATLGGITALTCTALFGTGFWVSLLAQRGHPVSFTMVLGNFREFSQQPLILIAVVAAAVALMRRVLQTYDQASVAAGTAAAVSCGMLLLFLGKVGASTNYFIEPILALATAVACRDRGALESRRYLMMRAMVAAVLAVAALHEAMMLHPGHFDLTHASFNEDRSLLTQERTGLLRSIAGPDPKVLNLGTPAYSSELPGRISLSDPYCQLLIYRAGGLSMNKLLEAVKSKHFDVVAATPGMLGWLADEQNKMTVLLEAVKTSYPIARRHAGVIVLSPRGDYGQ
jgi:hypothetical protein